MLSNLIVLQISSGSSECHEELDDKVDDLEPTEDGKASEESDGAVDQSKLAHKAGWIQAIILHMLLNSVIGRAAYIKLLEFAYKSSSVSITVK